MPRSRFHRIAVAVFRRILSTLKHSDPGVIATLIMLALMEGTIAMLASSSALVLLSMIDGGE